MQPLGRAGEDFAARHLETAGYRILDRNWRTREGEVDLVALDMQGNRPEIVFCEVKTRTSVAHGAPAEAVTRVKQQRLRKTAAAWMREHRDMAVGAPGTARPDRARFDVIEVVVTAGVARARHIRDAF